MAERTYRVVIAAYPHRIGWPYVATWHVRATSRDAAMNAAFDAMNEPLSTWQHARSVGVLRKRRVWLSRSNVQRVSVTDI